MDGRSPHASARQQRNEGRGRCLGKDGRRFSPHLDRALCRRVGEKRAPITVAQVRQARYWLRASAWTTWTGLVATTATAALVSIAVAVATIAVSAATAVGGAAGHPKLLAVALHQLTKDGRLIVHDCNVEHILLCRAEDAPARVARNQAERGRRRSAAARGGGTSGGEREGKGEGRRQGSGRGRWRRRGHW